MVSYAAPESIVQAIDELAAVPADCYSHGNLHTGRARQQYALIFGPCMVEMTFSEGHSRLTDHNIRAARNTRLDMAAAAAWIPARCSP